MKKIMFVLTVYEIGGASTVAKNLLEALESDGAEIVLMVEKLPDRHYSINPRIRLINLDIFPQKGVVSKLSNLFRHFLKIRTMIIKESPDAILSFGTPANCHVLISLLFIGRKTKPRVIISEHSEEIFLNPKNQGMKYAISKACYRILRLLLYPSANFIVAVSKSIASDIKKIFLISPRKIKVIYNPVDIQKVNKLCKDGDQPVDLEEKVPCIGTITRLSPEKGTHFLIRGFRALLDRVDTRLVIVGDGPERERLERLADELGLGGKVTFTGWVENPFRYLAEMDVFVLPSLWEGFPNVILEAMACGVPVIAADSAGGIREAVKNGVNGILVKPGSSGEIERAAYDLLSDMEKRHRMIEEAYRGVRRYDIGEIRPQYEALLYR